MAGSPLQPGPYSPVGHAQPEAFAWLRVSPGAAESVTALVRSTRFAPGTFLLQSLAKAADAPPDLHYAMERGAEDWTFRVLDADGRTLPVDVAPCVRCHAEAMADGVFGLPRRESE